MEIVNNSSISDDIVSYISDLYGQMDASLGFTKPPKLFLEDDAENSSKILGKTAHYAPSNMSIVVYVTSRHPKDILRSIAHELIHHSQNLRGEFNDNKMGEHSEDYAQTNSHMRDMEKEAYMKGNIMFRDYEDSTKKKTLNEKKETDKEWYYRELFKKLRDKWSK